MGNISEAFGYWPAGKPESYAFLTIKFLIKMETTHNTHTARLKYHPRLFVASHEKVLFYWRTNGVAFRDITRSLQGHAYPRHATLDTTEHRPFTVWQGQSS